MTAPRTIPPLRLVVALLAIAGQPAPACTIFVLTDGARTLFFNNEDWSNPVTRIWFVPADEGHLGCAFVGFDNGWGQGGVKGTHRYDIPELAPQLTQPLRPLPLIARNTSVLPLAAATGSAAVLVAFAWLARRRRRLAAPARVTAPSTSAAP